MSGGSDEIGTAALRASVNLALEPPRAFDAVVEGLVDSLARLGISLEPSEMGVVVEDGSPIGRVEVWRRGERILLGWRPVPWVPDEATEVEIRFEPAGTGTAVCFERRGWSRLLADADDRAGWFAGSVVAPLLHAMAPGALGDWLTDRRARRPSGAEASVFYRDPLYHYPSFRVILEELALTAEDVLIELGCGGGAMLREALESGCRAAAVDHSPAMVRLAVEENRDAVSDGRLDVRHADAAALPFADASFTSAAMTGVLGFLPDPVAALREVRRVLRPGGRLVAMGCDPELRGTPAAPEPMASRLRFYESADLKLIAIDAGFADVEVVRRSLYAYAQDAGVPAEHLSLYAGPGSRFLLARTPR